MLQILLFALCQGIHLEETVISAPRGGASATSSAATRRVLQGEELRETGARSLPAALARVGGVWMQETNLGGGAPVLRGLLGGRILILVDGVRLNDSTTRLGPNQSLAGIDISIVDSVEVIRGPGSVLYGSDAIGGVILIWTRRRAPSARDTFEPLKPWEGELAATQNTSHGGPYLSLRMSTASENHALLGQVSGFDYSDFKAGDNEVVENTGYNSESLFGTYEYAMGPKESLNITARVTRDFDVPRTDRLNVGFGQTQPSNQEWRYTLQDRRGYLISYSDNRPGALADRAQLRFFVNTYEEERDITNGAGTSSTFSRDEITTVGVGMDWQATLGGDQLLTWGLDLAHDEVDAFREQVDASGKREVAGNFAPDASYGRAGFFLQDELLGFAPWFWTVGLRYSVFDYSFAEFGTSAEYAGHFDSMTASLAVARELGQGNFLTASVAQGFHAPNLEDLANGGSFAGGTEIPNPELDPEESLSVDLGLATEREAWGAALGLFATRIDDAFGRVLLDGGDPAISGDETYQRANTGRLELAGFEAAFHHRLGEETPYSFEASAAYVEGRQMDPSFNGRVPARRVPPLHGSLALSYEPEEVEFFYIPNGRFQVLWAAGQDRLHPEDQSDPRIDPNGSAGWVTYNMEVWGDFNSEATWHLGLLNLTDETYRVHGSGIDGAGRRAVLGVHFSF